MPQTIAVKDICDKVSGTDERMRTKDNAEIVRDILPRFIDVIASESALHHVRPEELRSILASEKTSSAISSAINKAIELKATYGDFRLYCSYIAARQEANYKYYDPCNTDYDVIDGYYWTDSEFRFNVGPRTA